MKHIDLREAWVDILRTKDTLNFIRIPGEDNDADFFTKILDEDTFLRHRDTMMVKLPADKRGNARL